MRVPRIRYLHRFRNRHSNPGKPPSSFDRGRGHLHGFASIEGEEGFEGC